MKDRAKLRGEIIDILQDTDWSDQGIENMADKIIALSDDVGQSEQFYCDERDEYGNTECNQQCMMCVRDEQAK
jgi:hypothetical protein